MAYKPPFQSYQEIQNKKKNRSPMVFGVLSVLFIVAGVLLIWNWINGAGGGGFSLFQTDTPTPTTTATMPPPTNTPENTLRPTETLIPTITPTGTAAVPFEYQVQSGDSLSSIAENFGIDEIILIMVVNELRSDFLTAGQVLIIPNPDMELPTPTALPPGLRSGDVIEYMVLPGDSVQIIAEKFLSTEDGIIAENELSDSYLIFPGQILLVPYWLITPTFGPPDSTATPIVTPTP